MREIERLIASAIIFSIDVKILMGRKDPLSGGVYTDCWHIPGGGVEEGQTLEDAVISEVQEETGLTVTREQLKKVEEVGSGTSEKRLKDTGEVVKCHMTFHRFEIHLNKTASECEVTPKDDLIELKWLAQDELAKIKHIPGGREFFVRQGYIAK